jgi:hypothetical protein
MEPERSLQCTQEPAAVPYPEPDEYNPHPYSLFLEDPFYYYYPPIYA